MISKLKRILLLFYVLVYSFSNVCPVYATESNHNLTNSVDDDTGGSKARASARSTETDFQGSDEEAFKQSLIASQFATPLGNTMYDVLSDPTIKELLPDLYENGKPKEFTYVKLLKKNSSGDYIHARLLDLFSMDVNNNSQEFFIEYEYEYEVEEVDKETGEVTIKTETETKYEKVYYSNAYSYFYLTLFIGYQPSLYELFNTLADKYVDIDNYGNIVINDSNTNEAHRRMVIPNIVNPMLNVSDSFYLPTLRFIYMYDNNIKSLNDNQSLTSDRIKSIYGSRLRNSGIGIFSIDGSSRLDLYHIFSKSQKPELSEIINIPDSSLLMSVDNSDYLEYLNAGANGTSKSKRMMLFTFGNSFRVGLFNRFYPGLIAGELKEIMPTGTGSKSGSMALLPEDRLYLGNTSSDFKFENNSISIVDSKGKDKGNYSYYYHDFNSYLNGTFSVGTSGQPGSITQNEIALITSLVNGFYNKINKEKVINLVYNSTEQDSENGKPSESIVNTPEDAYDQKVNNIVNKVDFFFNNVGTSTSSMSSSKISKQYYNLNTAFNENLLFNVTDVLEDEFVKNMLGGYLNLTCVVSLIIFLLALLKYIGTDKSYLLSYMKSSIIGVSMCLVPLIVFALYIKACNLGTEFVMQDSYVNWFVADVNTDNNLSEKEINMNKESYSYFKEANALPMKNKGQVYFYDSVPDENGSYLKLTSLNELNRVGLVRSDGTEESDIFANKDSYYKSIFFYFYDTYRWHMYNYYGGQLQGWDNENGLINTKGNFTKMISDPGFLYGNSYLKQEQAYMNGESSGINYRNVMVQDILGLTHLFTSEEVFGRESYNEYIRGSYWYRLIKHHNRFDNMGARGKHIEDITNSENYLDGTIYGSKEIALNNGVKGFSDFELVLQDVNATVAVELQKLLDYKDCVDETLIYAASLISTFEFNKAMNSYMKSEYKLSPTTFNSSTYSMDTVYRSIFMRDLDQESLYGGDLILAIESQGGFLVQMLTLVSTFVGQVVGLTKLISSVLLFILSIVVFLFAYNINKNLFNKAWLGLLSLFTLLWAVHFVFLLCVNFVCVPEYAIIRNSIFKSYLPGLKVFLLLCILLLKGAAIGYLVYFAFKYYRDLGGTFVAERIESVAASVTGVLDGTLSEGELDSNETRIKTDNVDMETEASGIESDGTVQFNQQSSDSDSMAIDVAEASIQDMSASSNNGTHIDGTVISNDVTVDNTTATNLDSGSTIHNDITVDFSKTDNSVIDNSISREDNRTIRNSLHNNNSQIKEGDSLANDYDYDYSNTSKDFSTDRKTQSVTNIDEDNSKRTDSKSVKTVYNNGNETSVVDKTVVEESTTQSSMHQSSSTTETKSGSGSTYDALKELTSFMDESSSSMKRSNIFNQLHKEREGRANKK